VAQGVREMSPETLAAVIGGVAGGVVGGVLGIVGVAVGLFRERWVRSWGKVWCEVVDWRVSEGPSTAPTVRELEVRFVNEKELPAIVLDMWVAHYKGDEPLEVWARPDLMFGSGVTKTALSPVNVPARSAVTRTFSLIAGRDDMQRELAATNRAEFVANIVGAGKRRAELSPTWRD
jgi:hypothetical protein